jgi:hypothetical protein
MSTFFIPYYIMANVSHPTQNVNVCTNNTSYCNIVHENLNETKHFFLEKLQFSLQITSHSMESPSNYQYLDSNPQTTKKFKKCPI